MYQGQGIGSYRTRRQLGALPAVLPAVMTLNSALGIFGLNSSDPVKDQERINRINVARQAALAGDTRPIPLLGNRTGEAYLNIVGTDSRQAGSQVAFRYAQVALAEVAARRVAGRVGTGLVAVSDIPNRAQATLVNNLPLIIGGAVVGYMLLRKRR